MLLQTSLSKTNFLTMRKRQTVYLDHAGSLTADMMKPEPVAVNCYATKLHHLLAISLQQRPNLSKHSLEGRRAALKRCCPPGLPLHEEGEDNTRLCVHSCPRDNAVSIFSSEKL